VDIRVAIVEDDPTYRATLEMVLTTAPGFQVVKSCASAEEAVRAFGGRVAPIPRPQLALVDIDLPGMDGIELVRWLKERFDDVDAVMLTAFEQPATILAAIQAGADGYILKSTPFDEFFALLRAVASGGSPLSAAVARTVLDVVRRDQVSARRSSAASLGLTTRELDVLRSLVDGNSYKQVADDLGISIHTVRTHVRGLYRKLQVHSVGEAVSRALREGVV